MRRVNIGLVVDLGVFSLSSNTASTIEIFLNYRSMYRLHKRPDFCQKNYFKIIQKKNC